MRTSCTLAGLVLALATFGHPAAGQIWSVDTYVGRVDYATLPAASDSASAGIRFNQDRRFFRAAVGVPLSGGDLKWGVLEAGDRLAVRRSGLVAGADVALSGQAWRDPAAQTTGYGLLTELMPVLSHSAGASVLEVRSGPRWYGARLGTEDWSRAFWTTEFRGSLAAGESLRLESDLRHERGGESERYTRAGFSLTATPGPTTFRVSVGGWIDGPPETDPEWGASLAVPVRPNMWVFTAVRHESFNPHFLNPPRTSFGVGLSWQIGGVRRAPAAGAEVRDRGEIVLRLPLREARTAPFVAGDFTGWEPVRMRRHGNEWRWTGDLPSGVYHYAFRSADGEWFVPASVPYRTDDGMGGTVAVLVVP